MPPSVKPSGSAESDWDFEWPPKNETLAGQVFELNNSKPEPLVRLAPVVDTEPPVQPSPLREDPQVAALPQVAPFTRQPATRGDLRIADVPPTRIPSVDSQTVQAWILPGAVVVLALIAILEGVFILKTRTPPASSSPVQTSEAQASAPAAVAPTSGTVVSEPADATKPVVSGAGAKSGQLGAPSNAAPRRAAAAGVENGVRARGARAANTGTSGVRGAEAAGWIAITSPVEVDVFEDGALLGTSRSPRIMLPEGSHSLEWVNEALGYRDKQNVRIDAGKVTAFTVALPQSVMHINAVPWAEVWIDGKSVGETPIGNLSIAIGSHDVVFRHPELGEKTVSALVKPGTATKVTADLRSR